MNNKGQTLVLFVILLPVIFILLALVSNNVVKSYQIRKTNNVIKMIITDNMDKLDLVDLKEKISFLIDENIENYEEKSIIIDEKSLSITIKLKLDGTFSNITDETFYEVTYIGTNKNNKTIVRRG